MLCLSLAGGWLQTFLLNLMIPEDWQHTDSFQVQVVNTLTLFPAYHNCCCCLFPGSCGTGMAVTHLADSVSQHTPRSTNTVKSHPTQYCQNQQRYLDSSFFCVTCVRFVQTSGIPDVECLPLLLTQWKVPKFVPVFRGSRNCLGEVTALYV